MKLLLIIIIFITSFIIQGCFKEKYELPTTNALDPLYSEEQFIFIDSTEVYYDVTLDNWAIRVYQHVDIDRFGAKVSYIEVNTKFTSNSLRTWTFNKTNDSNNGVIVFGPVSIMEAIDCEMFVISGDAQSKSFYHSFVVEF